MLNKFFDLQKKENFYYNGIYFIFVLVAVFSITYGTLYYFNITPKGMGRGEDIEEDYTTDYWLGDYDIKNDYVETYETKPDRILIPKINVDTTVAKPNSRDVSVLDQFLTKGSVYYPGSGTIEKGNIFIFGHSTTIKVVRNQAYKTFNGLEKLQYGDEIFVETERGKYVYKVNTVKLLNENDALIIFDNSKRLLTLTTCNTFGQKQERWVVEAEFYKSL